MRAGLLSAARSATVALSAKLKQVSITAAAKENTYSQLAEHKNCKQLALLLFSRALEELLGRLFPFDKKIGLVLS